MAKSVQEWFASYMEGEALPLVVGGACEQRPKLKPKRRPPPASAEEWFATQVRPDAPLADYLAAAPRGMTNPPGSEKVRKALLQDLADYGVTAQVREWPPPAPPPARPPPVLHPGGKPRRPVSAAAAVNRRPPSAVSAQRQSASHRRPHSAAAGRPASASSSTSGERKGKRPASAPTGEKRIFSIPGDELGAPTLSTDGRMQSYGYPTARWRPTEFSIDSRALMTTEQADTSDASPRSGAVLGFAEASLRSNQSQEVEQRPVHDDDIRRGQQELRCLSGHKRAACADRFRRAADVTKGALAPAHEAWESDGAVLISFHNRALRAVNPSGLQAAEPPKGRRRRNSQADDYLVMGSGTFQPKYQVDDALVKLRRIKRTMFPETCRRRKPEVKVDTGIPSFTIEAVSPVAHVSEVA
eukprot:TRINITY_DN4562_c0_g1_i1.p1 TRINITY_DN4562_c0_g1~~TRINITY_DN4562_c0_g1_i1.p1  ORF type:complete len:413 (+),score=66.20 TRINITY_DN4562_c0_g1_i1:124-1362(+)